MRDRVEANRLLVLGGGAERAGALHDAIENLRRVRVDLHPADGSVGLVLADLQLLDGEVAAEVHHDVHHLRQHHRVDDVALQDEARGVPALRQVRAPAARLICAFNAAASRPGLPA